MIKKLNNGVLEDDLQPLHFNDKRFLNAIAIINDKEKEYLSINGEGKFILNVKPNDIIEVSCINLVECTEIQYYYIVLCIDNDNMILSRKYDNYNELSFLKKAIITNHLIKTKYNK